MAGSQRHLSCRHEHAMPKNINILPMNIIMRQLSLLILTIIHSQWSTIKPTFIMQRIMFAMQLPYQPPTTIMQTIVQHQTILTHPAAAYIPLWGCPIPTTITHHRKSPSNSEEPGSSPAFAGINHCIPLHHHIPTKRGRSLVSAVFCQLPPLRTQMAHHKPSTKPLYDTKRQGTHVFHQQPIHAFYPAYCQCHPATPNSLILSLM